MTPTGMGEECGDVRLDKYESWSDNQIARWLTSLADDVEVRQTNDSGTRKVGAIPLT